MRELGSHREEMRESQRRDEGVTEKI